MFINPIVFGVFATIGGECVLTVLALVVAVLRYSKRNGMTIGHILKAAWGETEDAATKQPVKGK